MVKDGRQLEYQTLHSVEYTERIYDKVLQKMVMEKKYRDPKCSAVALAKDIGVNTRCLSLVINLRYRENFSQMLNDLRIREVLYMLTDRHFRDLPIEAISKRVGYATRQSFYAAFMNRTGMTPNEYRAQYSSDNVE